MNEDNRRNPIGLAIKQVMGSSDPVATASGLMVSMTRALTNALASIDGEGEPNGR